MRIFFFFVCGLFLLICIEHEMLRMRYGLILIWMELASDKDGCGDCKDIAW